MKEITTTDGATLREGARAYNYYDMEPGYIERIDDHPQPDTMRGQSSATPISEWSNFWFTFRADDGGRTSLDGSRICTIRYAIRKGWYTAGPEDCDFDYSTATIGNRTYCRTCDRFHEGV